LFGLNYAAGFVTMHLLHFTLATKQPAMTASYIASALDPSNPKSTHAKKAFRFVITSQFVSLIGNLIVVLPLCYFIGWSVFNFAESAIFSQEEAEAALYSNHPFLSLSLIYAGVTAIFLSASGIITGLVDNKIQFSEIPYRIIHHPLLKKRIAPDKLNKIAAFVEKNGGAISGNIFLGLALGMAGNFGNFLGLPFDIRHITISAGNFGFATGSGWSFSTELIVTVFFGVIFIGLINVIASFLISFGLACKSRNISFRNALKILFG
jgi:site-specific recombinase